MRGPWKVAAILVLFGSAGEAPCSGDFPTGQGLLDLNALWSQGKAEGKGPVRFKNAPMRLADIDVIVPYGLMVGGHVAPIDHQYYYPKPIAAGAAHFDVLAPADGFIVRVGHRVKLFGSTEKQRDYDDFALVIEHSRYVYSHYDLLTKLDKSILDALPPEVRDRFVKKAGGPPTLTRIPVKAGQVLGKIGGRSLDFGVIDTRVALKGFLSTQLYGHYAWRVHTIDPFDLFDEPLRGRLLELNPRKAEPRGGRIDYDIDGKFVGVWFKEGTNGYAGTRDPRGYWMGHLALAYHHIDPTKVVVSIGDFDGQPRQFWVKGNGPDPAKLGKADGLVKYDLIWGRLGGSGKPFAGIDDKVQGVLLVQMLEDRRLRVEAVRGKTSVDVPGFSKASAIYVR